MVKDKKRHGICLINRGQCSTSVLLDFSITSSEGSLVASSDPGLILCPAKCDLYWTLVRLHKVYPTSKNAYEDYIFIDRTLYPFTLVNLTECEGPLIIDRPLACVPRTAQMSRGSRI